MKEKLKKIVPYIYPILILVLGFSLGYFEGKRTANSKSNEWKINQVTIGFTNKNGFMIFNHELNRLDIYDEEAGKFLFWSYSKRIKEELEK